MTITVIEQKTIELGRFLTGKSTVIDFTEPSSELLKHDDRELRRKILALTQSDAKELGIGKSTLHYQVITCMSVFALQVVGLVLMKRGLSQLLRSASCRL